MLADDGMHKCDNCARVWPAAQLADIKDLAMRLTPGRETPSGECPECGALCYIHKEEAALPPLEFKHPLNVDGLHSHLQDAAPGKLAPALRDRLIKLYLFQALEELAEKSQSLRDELAAFRRACEVAEYTDTDVVWTLLFKYEKLFEAMSAIDFEADRQPKDTP